MSMGWSKPTLRKKWLNVQQYLELWDEAFSNVADDQALVFGRSAEQ